MACFWQQENTLRAVLLDGLNKYPFHQIGYMTVYHTLTKCAIQMDDNAKAWAYIQRGLHYGDDNAYAWGTINLITPTIELLIIENQHAYATEILSLMIHHPATTEGIKASVSTQIETLKTHLNLSEFEAAWERGKQLDLGNVITDLLEK